MGRKLKIDTGEPKLGPYTPGINVKDHIWLSGQIDIESGDEIESQTIGTLAKIDDLLAAANSSKGDLVKVTILMVDIGFYNNCLLYTSPSPRDRQKSRMPSSA